MKRKTMSFWAVVLVVVFGATVIIYPMFFNPEDEKAPATMGEPTSTPPVNMSR